MAIKFFSLKCANRSFSYQAVAAAAAAAKAEVVTCNVTLQRLEPELDARAERVALNSRAVSWGKL